MTACERCWAQAYAIARRTGRHQADIYRELMADNGEIHGEIHQPVLAGGARLSGDARVYE
jgi:hypothetical protein